VTEALDLNLSKKIGTGAHMPWWGWTVIGAVLLGTETFVIDAQFYLVFLGIAAVAVGLIGLAGVGLPAWAQWLVFASLSIATMLGFRTRSREKACEATGSAPQSASFGSRIILPACLKPGESCRVEYRGSTWTARSIDTEVLSGEVEIARVEGITLLVRQLHDLGPPI